MVRRSKKTVMSAPESKRANRKEPRTTKEKFVQLLEEHKVEFQGRKAELVERQTTIIAQVEALMVQQKALIGLQTQDEDRMEELQKMQVELRRGE